MIHLSARSPLEGYECAVLYGKGPSYDPFACPSPIGPLTVRIGINDAATVAHDFVALRDWTTAERLKALPTQGLVAQSVWFRYKARWGYYDRYFDESRILGTTEPSRTVPGRKLGVGTATAVLQMLAEAGCYEVYLNGFDAFFGGEIVYADAFTRRGLSHDDYAEQFPASGSPEEQAALVKESMEFVIKAKGIKIGRLD